MKQQHVFHIPTAHIDTVFALIKKMYPNTHTEWSHALENRVQHRLHVTCAAVTRMGTLDHTPVTHQPNTCRIQHDTCILTLNMQNVTGLTHILVGSCMNQLQTLATCAKTTTITSEADWYTNRHLPYSA